MYTGAKIGSFIAAVLFFLFGLTPSLLYGGYMGLIMAITLLGPITTTAGLGAQLIVAGGMCLGFVATLSLFLVLGALIGSGVHALLSSSFFLSSSKSSRATRSI